MANEGQLLVRLCLLLSNENLRLSAADCLLAVVGRKGPAKRRAPLLVLFNMDAISSMLQAAQLASSSESEQSYAFLKRLSDVLAGLFNCCLNWIGCSIRAVKRKNFFIGIQPFKPSGLGAQLCALYGREESVTRPESLPVYLQVFLFYFLLSHFLPNCIFGTR